MESSKRGMLLEGEPVDPVDPEVDDGEPNPAGRIVHDERGNALWKWRGDTSSTGGTSGVLQYIEAADLAVEGGGSGQSSGKPTGVLDAGGGGYDPYNQGRPRSNGAPAGKPARGKSQR